MTPDNFARLVERFLVPMFPGSAIIGARKLDDRIRRSPASFENPNAIRVRLGSPTTLEVTIRRSQKFSSADVDIGTGFVAAAKAVSGALGKSYEGDVLRSFPLRMIAWSFGAKSGEALFRILEQFSSWSSISYEGRPITATMGLSEDDSKRGDVSLADLWAEPFSPVLTNGIDTILVASHDCSIIRYESLDPPTSMDCFAPIRFIPLAQWSNDGKIGVALTRSGEILIFSDGALAFARRGGQWHHYAHESITKVISLPRNRVTRRALYDTIIDASFAKTGACFGIVHKSSVDELPSVISFADDVRTPKSVKTKLISRTIRGPYSSIDRKLRAELAALDGATILDGEGNIIAVGAIVSIGGGSTGGGRLAAAKRLASLGLGIKVSQDGGVTGFSRDGTELFRFA